MAKSTRRKKVMMVSEGKFKNGKPTKTVYYTTRGDNNPEKLKLKRCDPYAWNGEKQKYGMHVVFNEKKVPK